MTEAGWTREKPTAAGWYWYRSINDEQTESVVWVAPNMGVFSAFYHSRVEHLDGEWLGPISPDSYQQGRVEGLRECKHGLDIALDEGPLKAALYRWIDARAERLEREAQQAQEGGVGDANG